MQHLHFHPEKGVVMVKQGFSWPAAIFGSLWAIAHHMWFPYVLLLLPIEGLLWFLARYVQAHPSDPMLLVMGITSLALVFVRGRYGNAWMASWLRRHGYTRRDDLLPAATAAQHVAPRVAG